MDGSIKELSAYRFFKAQEDLKANGYICHNSF